VRQLGPGSSSGVSTELDLHNLLDYSNDDTDLEAGKEGEIAYMEHSGREGGDVEGEEREGSDVFLSQDEEAEAQLRTEDAKEREREENMKRAMDEMRERKERQERLERRRLARMEEEDRVRKVEEARISGRESGAKYVRGRIDHRYHAVRALRNNIPDGRELNGEAMQNEPVTHNGFIQEGDDRWLRNFNVHSLERKVNVSCSFNPRSGLCYTCLRGVHTAWEGMDREPIVLIAADHSVPANAPSAEGGECVRILRVEDGTLHEITRELLMVLKKRMVVPGTVIMLGSLTHMCKEGTAHYAAEWSRCRREILAELGTVVVVPAFHLPASVFAGGNVVRSLLEFTNWYLDLPDTEVGLLRKIRREYLDFVCAREEVGVPWANYLQMLRLPVSLSAEGTSR